MIRQINRFIPVLAIALVTSSVFANTPEQRQDGKTNSTQTKIQSAINADSRPKDDVARDANRLPAETLAFFELRDDMKVLDLLPASYYTRILAPVLKDEGELYLALGTSRLDFLKEKDFRHVRTVSEKTNVQRPDGARHYEMSELNLDVRNLDMVTNFRAYHLFDEADRKTLNDAVFKTLKSGGIYAVIDHTARHNEPETEANRRRFDPVKAIKEIEDAGFDFVDYSPIHYRANDALDLEVGHKDVTGQTDRWTLKFVKL